MINKEDLKIVFFGTPQFAVESLKKIIDNNFNVVAVVTAPDKPAGRGYQLQKSAVKQYAESKQIPVLQPTNLKSDEFIEDLKKYQAKLQIVIAFRMLPEKVWNMPSLGTFNLHASFLPNYRGAAPINWAIINGEKETGVTTFFLKHAIDTGSIILQEKTEIWPSDNVGILHDKLMLQGADLVVKTLNKILEEDYTLQPQIEGEFPHASKIFTEQCKIDWHKNAAQVHNLIRGLSPYPAAFTSYNEKSLKIFETQLTSEPSSNPGNFEIKNKTELLVNCADFKLKIISIQPEGKKRMLVVDFLNGLRP